MHHTIHCNNRPCWCCWWWWWWCNPGLLLLGRRFLFSGPLCCSFRRLSPALAHRRRRGVQRRYKVTWEGVIKRGGRECWWYFIGWLELSTQCTLSMFTGPVQADWQPPGLFVFLTISVMRWSKLNSDPSLCFHSLSWWKDISVSSFYKSASDQFLFHWKWRSFFFGR